MSIEGGFDMRINFNLKDTSRVGGKKSQIILTTTIKKERVRIYTGLSIEPLHWNKGTKTCVNERAIEDESLGIVILKENKKINKRLDEILRFCKEYSAAVNTPSLLGTPMEHSKANFETFIKDKLANRKQTTKSFIEQYIEKKKTMVNGSSRCTISSGTIYNHKNTLKRLESFCSENHLALTWELFNRDFESRLTAWMNSKNYMANTIAATFSIIKIWLKEAEIKGIISDKSFHSYRADGIDVDNTYLKPDEINRIYAIDFKSKDIKAQINPRDGIEQTRDLFVLACWTGLRLGDFSDLSEAVVDGENLIVHTKKTKQTVAIPIVPIVKEIIDKYSGHLPKLPHRKHSIRQIQKCCELAGINETVTLTRVHGGQREIIRVAKYKFITNHTARRSYATNLYRAGIPIRSIMAITGHKTEKNFLKYIKLNQLEHAEIVAKTLSETMQSFA